MKKIAIFGFFCAILSALINGACVPCSALAESLVVQTLEDIKLESKSAFLIDSKYKTVMFEQNADEKLPVASMVKMMTILLSFEALDCGDVNLDTMVITSKEASAMGGSQVFIDPYVQYKFEDLLKSVIMASANDASVAIAEHLAGSEKGFVMNMNKRAKELGMTKTNYVNCTGLPAPEGYSTARDSATLLCEILKHEHYHDYSTIWMDELVHPSGRKTELVNTNRLIRYYDGCDGGKTGSTSEAGCCLCASAVRDNMRLVSVIIGAPNSKTRFNESAELFNYGFANFEQTKLVDKDKTLAVIPVSKGKKLESEVKASEDFFVISQKGDDIDYKVELKLPQQIKAPHKKGDKVGSLLVIKDGQIEKEIDIILDEELVGISILDSLRKIADEW